VSTSIILLVLGITIGVPTIFGLIPSLLLRRIASRRRRDTSSSNTDPSELVKYYNTFGVSRIGEETRFELRYPKEVRDRVAAQVSLKQKIQQAPEITHCAVCQGVMKTDPRVRLVRYRPTLSDKARWAGACVGCYELLNEMRSDEVLFPRTITVEYSNPTSLS